MKRFGELATRLKINDNRTSNHKNSHTRSPVDMEQLQLSKREIGELIFEGVFTIALIYLIYLGIQIIIKQLLEAPLLGLGPSYSIRQQWSITPRNLQLYNIIFTWLSVIGGTAITAWRLIRRYRQMQLTHILDELHYIAEGHIDYQIPFQVRGDMGKVVTSINALVQNTVKAMSEERKIEQSKDELITNVSHDIRTPLTSIIGYLGLVRDGQFENEEEVKRYIDIADKKAKQMKHLVDDLFEYTTTRSIATHLQKRNIVLTKFLEQVCAEFEWEAEKKGVTITLDSENSNLVIDLDPDRMVRVFSNLITNALKYGEHATYIKVSDYVDNEKKEVFITVENNGEKIPKEAIDHLFNRFYRVEASRSVETGGSGLGLAISENIVMLHGGRIEVTSDDDKTRFIVILPLESKDQSETEEAVRQI